MLDHPEHFDVIVVGGGHAGTEAALAAARVGASTLLLTQSIETVGQMSCNPAIGGIGKSHLVREIDALDGAMARAADAAGIQFRVLNASKGPAVRATRAQTDRTLYRNAVRAIVERQENLRMFQQSVVDLLVRDGAVQGVVTGMGLCLLAPSVVLATGTFLGGRIHIGFENHPGGRAGDAPANALAERLRALPFRVGRLKTGTPPRIDRRGVDFSALEEQPGDEPTPSLSFLREPHPQQVSCFIAQTNARTHGIIRRALDRSPLFTGAIEGPGPRYCPSIEDKVVRFPDRQRHQIFVEPEGLNSVELYPNGISTSLPFDAQVALVQSIEGFEKAHITRPGYAIEYDFLDPRDLEYSLETRSLVGLFLAGQINGTTGYEEAAAQGLLAGLNAARKAQGRSPWYPGRDEAYIGVMIDDLVNLGASEPYRMFTSRAEYRLRLREDNADIRLSGIGRDLGLVGAERWRAHERRTAARKKILARLKTVLVKPGSDAARLLEDTSGAPLGSEVWLIDYLKRPEAAIEHVKPLLGDAASDAELLRQVETGLKYEGYVKRQDAEIAKIRRNENIALPVDTDYHAMPGLSMELRHKLDGVRPATLARAARIPGMTPAGLSVLMIHATRIQSGKEDAVTS